MAQRTLSQDEAREKAQALLRFALKARNEQTATLFQKKTTQPARRIQWNRSG